MRWIALKWCFTSTLPPNAGPVRLEIWRARAGAEGRAGSNSPRICQARGLNHASVQRSREKAWGLFRKLLPPLAFPNRKVSGGAEGNRTPDLRSAIAALSHLSYSPVEAPAL